MSIVDDSLKRKLQTGEIDVNGQEIFFRSLLKAYMFNLSNKLSLRNIPIPHMIINTGDDIMYREVKGQKQSIEPHKVSNEDYVYNTVPRACVTPGSVNILFDQLTNPYTRGTFQIENEDIIKSYVSEFRRFPVKMDVKMKYYFDTFTDALEVMQQFIVNFGIVQTFTFDYLGRKILASYKMPESWEIDTQFEFDGLASDSSSKQKTFEVSIEIETNMPIFYPKTIMESSDYIKEFKHSVVRTPGNKNLDIQEDTILNNIDNINKQVDAGIHPLPIGTIKKNMKNDENGIV